MDDHYEFVGINPTSIEDRIPHAWDEPVPIKALDALMIQKEVFQAESDQREGEIQRAKKAKTYIGFTDEKLQREIPEFIRKCLDEMVDIETAARKPAEERLAKLRQIAPNVTRIIVRSAPGDYYHLNKKDKYEKDPAMQGADRVRGDQAAILTMVLAGIRENWPKDDLLFLLNQHILMSNNERLNKLRERAIQAVKKSGIRLVYTGREDEVKAVERVLGKPHIFIPRDSVDVLSPDGIHNTIDQTRQLKDYLAAKMHSGEAFVEVTNVQAVRSRRMENAQEMIPPDIKPYLYAMPTVGGERSDEYRKGEIRGALFYALTKQASFDPAPHEII